MCAFVRVFNHVLMCVQDGLQWTGVPQVHFPYMQRVSVIGSESTVDPNQDKSVAEDE